MALLLAAAVLSGSLAAQSPDTGSIEGKLTDLYSKPLDGAAVVLRNVSTGAEFRAQTGRNGAYRLGGLTPGSYELEARTADSNLGHSSGIMVMAGHAARVHTAVALSRQPAWAARPPQTTPPSQTRGPVATTAAILPGVPARGTAVIPALTRNSASPGTLALAAEAIAPGGTLAGPAMLSLPRVSSGLSRTGLLLSSAAAASLRAALATAANVPRRIEAEASQPEPAEAAISMKLSGEELQALPLSGPPSEDASLESVPDAAPSDADEDAHHTTRQPRAGAGDRATRLAFGSRSATRREDHALLVPAASDATIRSIQIVAGTGDALAGIGAAETRSGADQAGGRVHGHAFFFDRQGLLSAQNPFAQWVKETAPATATTVPEFTPFPWSPEDRRTRWGVSAGGPLRRDRLFWFAAFDRQQRDHPAVATVKHPEDFFAQPSNDELQVLSARLGLGSADPIGAGLTAYSSMLETLAGLLGPAPRTSTENAAFARVDWNPAERHRFTIEATGSHWDSPGGGLTRASENYGSHSFGASRGSEYRLLGRWNAFLGPNLMATTQASIGHHILTHAAGIPSAFEQSLAVNSWGLPPQMIVDSRYGFTIGTPSRFGTGSYPDERSYTGGETVDWMRGSFLVRAGFELRHDADRTSFVRNHTGTYHYARLENFVSDALAFGQFGLNGTLDPMHQHNCDQRGKAWRAADGQLYGIGNLPCYSYYTQTLGPTEWHLETNDWAGFTTAQWKPRKPLLISAGLLWSLQQTPPPIALVANPDLPSAGRLPSLGSQWAPRIGLAWGTHESHWPVLRLGYGMYYGRTSNSVLETALTETGSPNGDLNLFARPADNLSNKNGGAPPFPYVLAGNPGATQKTGAVEIAPTYRNGEVHQVVASVEEELPGHLLVSVNALASLGRRLPVTVDTNIDPASNPGTITYSVVDSTGKGPIKSPQITVPFFASWPVNGSAGGRLNANYQQITQLTSRANSTYQAGMLRLARTGRHGLSFNLRYTYAHAMDWNPDEGVLQTRASVLDPLDFQQEYGASNLDIRHSVASYAVWQSPFKLRGPAAHFANGWIFSGIGQYHSGLPYTMRTAGSLAQEFVDGGLVVALGTGMNGYGGANRVYGVGRNTYRYPATWKADVRIGKRFALGHERELEFMAQSFNLFNHQNVTELETVGYYVDTGTTAGSEPKLNFLTGLKTGQTEFGQPLNINATDNYRERQFDFGIRFRFKHDFPD
jgi:Carboxypeptidase regulatory-like domain